MNKIYEGYLKDCKILGDMVLETDFHIEGEIIGRPILGYSKAGKLYGKLDFVYEDGFYTLLLFSNRFIHLLKKENIKN